MFSLGLYIVHLIFMFRSFSAHMLHKTISVTKLSFVFCLPILPSFPPCQCSGPACLQPCVLQRIHPHRSKGGQRGHSRRPLCRPVPGKNLHHLHHIRKVCNPVSPAQCSGMSLRMPAVLITFRFHLRIRRGAA